MAIGATPKRFTIDGVALYVDGVARNVDYGDAYSFDSPYPKRTWLMNDSVHISASAMLSSHEMSTLFKKWALHTSHQNHIALGDGYICEYCGTYTPRGCTNCINCGAPITLVPFVSPRNMDFIVSQYDIDAFWSGLEDGTTVAHFEIVSYDSAIVDMILGGEQKIVSIPHGFELSGDWMCEYCGAIMDKDGHCQYCGGNRLPFSDVLHIKHECLYCGNMTTGVICKRCGAHLSAITLKDRFDIV